MQIKIAIAIWNAIVLSLRESDRRTVGCGERLFAFLDDLHVSCQPARVVEIQGDADRVDAFENEHSPERPSCGKAGILPSGDPFLQTSAQGVKILGTPIGHEAFVKAQLMALRADHDVLLERIPAVPDLQAA